LGLAALPGVPVGHVFGPQPHDTGRFCWLAWAFQAQAKGSQGAGGFIGLGLWLLLCMGWGGDELAQCMQPGQRLQFFALASGAAALRTSSR
jgi:hypothetical protein